jgi:hypothetical protein
VGTERVNARWQGGTVTLSVAHGQPGGPLRRRWFPVAWPALVNIQSAHASGVAAAHAETARGVRDAQSVAAAAPEQIKMYYQGFEGQRLRLPTAPRPRPGPRRVCPLRPHWADSPGPTPAAWPAWARATPNLNAPRRSLSPTAAASGVALRTEALQG